MTTSPNRHRAPPTEPTEAAEPTEPPTAQPPAEPAVPTRRERLRTATVAEIKDLARRLLVAGGIPAVSLRAIARDMGMTAPAIYRYFHNLDALIAELTADLYDELRQAVEAARDQAGPQPIERLLAMTRAFRHWSINHPAEFGLMFGNPVRGVVDFEEGCADPGNAGARFGAPFLDALTQLWRSTPFPVLPTELLADRLGPQLGPYRALPGFEAPIEVIYTYLSAWIRLYGIVAMEIFGHLQWAITDVEALFEVELAAFAAHLSSGGRDVTGDQLAGPDEPSGPPPFDDGS